MSRYNKKIVGGYAKTICFAADGERAFRELMLIKINLVSADVYYG